MSEFKLADEKKEERMKKDLIGWLSSVRPDGRPHSVPVWFLWLDDRILVFSKPNNQKIRNIRHNQAVVFALDDTRIGEDVIILEGTATLLGSESNISMLLSEYLSKYEPLITSYGWNSKTLAAEYSQPIEIIPQKLLRMS